MSIPARQRGVKRGTAGDVAQCFGETNRVVRRFAMPAAVCGRTTHSVSPSRTARPNAMRAGARSRMACANRAGAASTSAASIDASSRSPASASFVRLSPRIAPGGSDPPRCVPSRARKSDGSGAVNQLPVYRCVVQQVKHSIVQHCRRFRYPTYFTLGQHCVQMLVILQRPMRIEIALRWLREACVVSSGEGGRISVGAGPTPRMCIRKRAVDSRTRPRNRSNSSVGFRSDAPFTRRSTRAFPRVKRPVAGILASDRR